MKILVYISRIFVGSLFIVSGLIKANDTIGFSYKLEEYFENGALAYRIRDWFGWETFSLEFLMEHALLLAILMCAAEIILGFAVLFGTKIKLTVYSLLGLTVLFFFLTLHTATCDGDATYVNLTTVEKASPEHNLMLKRIESNPEIVVREEVGNEITYEQNMPVQCVTDCGCFGDAMKGSLGRSLTPWESFMKDLVLMIFLIPIFISRKKIKINTKQEDVFIFLFSMAGVAFLAWVFDWYALMIYFGVTVGVYLGLKRFLSEKVMSWASFVLVGIMSAGFIIYTLHHLPIRDYRAYAVGKSIPDQMVLPEGAIPDVYENMFYYKNKTTGEVEEFTETTYPWDDDNYEFSDRKTKLIQAGDKADAADFAIKASDGNDYTQDYFSEPGYIFMLIAYDINKTDVGSFKKINTFVDQCNANGQYFIGLTASDLEGKVEDFRHDNQAMFDFYNCDDIVLKTIVRANPGVILLKEGKILAKWSADDLPDYEKVKTDYLK
jgi:uncharacterized membrane protein YphA (DoxX/SURF4 family)